MIVYNGWVSFLKCQLNSCFHASCTCIPSLKCTFCHHWIFNPSPHIPLQSTSNHPLQNLQLHPILQNEQNHKIIKSRKLMPDDNYLRQKNTTMTKSIKRWREGKRWSTYQWQATTVKKTPQPPTTSMSYNNEKNTTKSTRMRRKSQRQWQWCSK